MLQSFDGGGGTGAANKVMTAAGDSSGNRVQFPALGQLDGFLPTAAFCGFL